MMIVGLRCRVRGHTGGRLAKEGLVVGEGRLTVVVVGVGVVWEGRLLLVVVVRERGMVR